MSNAWDDFRSLPGRLLLDTNVLVMIQDEGEYIFEGVLTEGEDEANVDDDLRALRSVFQVNQRADFQFLVSPLTFAELANQTDMLESWRRIKWALDVMDVWLIMLEETRDRRQWGGSVQHRFKLDAEQQRLERELMQIPEFLKDPIDRLLLLNCRMGSCDAFLTRDRHSVLRHRKRLGELGIRVLRPTEFWDQIQPWAALWY